MKIIKKPIHKNLKRENQKILFHLVFYISLATGLTALLIIESFIGMGNYDATYRRMAC